MNTSNKEGDGKRPIAVEKLKETHLKWFAHRSLEAQVKKSDRIPTEGIKMAKERDQR